MGITDLQIPKDAMVEHITVKAGDVLVIHLEVGNIPTYRARLQIERVRDMIKNAKVFPDSVQFMVAPMRNGKPDLQFTTITPTP